MRTSLSVATGFVLVAGVVVGVTTAQASSEQTPPIQPIRVEAPAADSAAAAEPPALVPELPTDASAPQQAAPRDPNGYVAPPPVDDDDDDDDLDDADDADDDGPGDD